MDEIEKLLRKTNRKNRERLLTVIEALQQGQMEYLDIKKLSGSFHYRVRVGDFRIIFTMNNKKQIEIQSVRLRNEKTYRK